MKYSLLKEVVEQLEAFEQEAGHGQATLGTFARWLSAKSGFVPDDPARPPQERWNVQAAAAAKDVAMYLVYLNRYARLYTRKALEGSPLTTAEDFSYLAGLMRTDSLTKTELILLNKQEKTSGMEVIKRLLAGELIEQYDDPQDRRSKRLRITDRGRQTMFGIFEPMLAVSNLVTGSLTDAEKLTLVELLRKLNQFHEPLFLNHRDASLPDLMRAAQERQSGP